MGDYYQEGIENLEAGKMRDAEQAFLKLLQENPKHALGHSKLGLVYARIEDYKKAKESFQSAIEIDSKLVHAWNNLGNIARQEGNLEEARTYYQKAIEIDPENLIPIRNLRIVEKQLKWKPSFLQLFRKNKVDKT